MKINAKLLPAHHRRVSEISSIPPNKMIIIKKNYDSGNNDNDNYDDIDNNN